MGNISWLLWLAAPVLVTVVVALKVWWGGLPQKLTAPDAIKEHRNYLDALGRSIESGPK